MRDPMSWSIPVFRAFGIQVKVHLLFFIITLGLFLRQVGDEGQPDLVGRHLPVHRRRCCSASSCCTSSATASGPGTSAATRRKS